MNSRRRGSVSSISSKRSYEPPVIKPHDTLNDSMNVTTRRSKGRGLSHSSSRTNASINRNQRNGKSSFSASKKNSFSLHKPSNTSFLSPENTTTRNKTTLFSPQLNDENSKQMVLDTPPDAKRQRYGGSVPPLAINETTHEEESPGSEESSKQRVEEETDVNTSIRQPSPKPINPKAVKAMQHPKSVPRPPKQVIKSFFTSALASKNPRVTLSDDLMNDNSVKFETITTATTSISDQRYLAPAGILSFDQVLLPAIGLMEEKMLKKIQSKVQRDAPEYKKAIEQSRLLVRKSILAAIKAVEESRKQLYLQQEQTRKDRTIKRVIAREARAVLKAQERKRQESEMEEQRKVRAAERKKQLQNHFPRNQALRGEVVNLTFNITKLEKEEKRWIQAEKSLIQHEQEKASLDGEQTAAVSPEVVTIRVEKDPLQEQTENTMQDIVLSSTRIQQGLSAVQKILHESETVQKELYDAYQKDHMFHGYQGIQNKAGMIRFLSQE
eukprot:CAMPEP_0113643682 /NCGR_PEP_ID=MMETSP0017_2-20120614/22978_1 /TAXON_ID=2856 /ORGANISM="Cylindrotheca closterium" /LENGTH=496 /DNA_ID=CAMNT_0000555229 /DNA_START=47 /DNA_END=1537 /DNA_ORIENTATION=- /assembly_acc=CAM_ASM_000147